MTSRATIIPAIISLDPATRLRPAVAGDETFARFLFNSDRAGDFAAAGLPQAALEMLLDQQFRAQSAGYAARFPDAITLIIVRHDEAVGRLILATTDRRWRIVDILLLPSARGQGIGTDIIEAVARAAHQARASALVLSVLSNNAGARRLYSRLGFCECGGDVYIEMAKALGTAGKPI